MFSRFYLDLDQDFFSNFTGDFSFYQRAGRQHLTDQKRICSSAIDDYMRMGVLSASELESDWFPQIEADVFLSHSRGDRDFVEAFAGWLSEEMGLRCFVDSNVWNHASTLSEFLGNKYDEKVEMRNCSVSEHEKWSLILGHVDMILGGALLRQMDQTEAIFILNAGRAIHQCREKGFHETYSPWIFAEVTNTELLRRTPLVAYREYENIVLQENWQQRGESIQFLTVSYAMDLKHIERLEDRTLLQWLKQVKKKRPEYPLDCLYEFTRYRDEAKQTKQLQENISPEGYQSFKNAFSMPAGKKDSMEEVQPLMESTQEMKKWGCLNGHFNCPELPCCIYFTAKKLDVL